MGNDVFTTFPWESLHFYWGLCNIMATFKGILQMPIVSCPYVTEEKSLLLPMCRVTTRKMTGDVSLPFPWRRLQHQQNIMFLSCVNCAKFHPTSLPGSLLFMLQASKKRFASSSLTHGLEQKWAISLHKTQYIPFSCPCSIYHSVWNCHWLLCLNHQILRCVQPKILCLTYFCMPRNWSSIGYIVVYQ